MDIFTKNKILLWTIIFLFVLNILTISSFWFFFFNKPKMSPPPPMGPDKHHIQKFFEQELDLSKEQISQFEKLQNDFLKKTDGIRELMHSRHDSIFYKIFNEENTIPSVEKEFGELGEKMAELDKLTYNYFLNVKKLLNPEQQKKFKELFKEMNFMMLPGGAGKGGPRKDRFLKGSPDGCGMGLPAPPPPPRRNEN